MIQNTRMEIYYYVVYRLLFTNSITEELGCSKDLFNIGMQGLTFALEMKNDQVTNHSFADKVGKIFAQQP
jgi:hypothetical protein